MKLRSLLGLRVQDALDPWQLAPRVRLSVLSREEVLAFLTAQEGQYLLNEGSKCWSGGVLPVPLHDGTCLCILNPLHSERRNRITLMEEITHVHLQHVPSELITGSDSTDIRSYDQAQEGEAYGVGAAALMPWATLFHDIDTGRTIDHMSEQYNVTTELVRFRINTTGALKMYNARQRKR